ncbi:unnamed protein product [Clonostachys solani]|uniref:Zn(2)-C6 fungal-type domain-containing protein n=1 Tax=Clonostachys solani TaxID=160281 RepID=A0A9N9ZFN4_9HYPO|nr:unnamed protein product [Clonostachys solani]
MQRSRQSRRSACDRCRMYKLRCERPPSISHSPIDDGCRRCLKSGATCRTSVEGWHGASSTSSSQGAAVDSFASPNKKTAGQEHSAMDFSLPGFNFANAPGTPSSFISDTPRNRQGGGGPGSNMAPAVDGLAACFGEDPRGDLAAMLDSTDTSDAGVSSSNPLHDIFQLCAQLSSCHEDVPNTTTGGPGEDWPTGATIQTALSWTSRLSEILSSIPNGAHTTGPGANTAPEPQLPMSQLAGSPSQSKQVHQSAGPGSSPTSRLSHWWQPAQVVTRQSATTEGQGGAINPTAIMYPNHISSRPTNATQSRQGQGHSPDPVLLTTVLVTSYILIRREWRRIFSFLHSALEEAPGAVAVAAILPPLQMGGFILASSPTLQVMALLDLSSDMLSRIEACLGISPSAPWPGGRDAEPRGQAKPLSMLAMNPVSISIRETLLSQEHLKISQDGHEYSTLDLYDIMSGLKERLSSRA